MLQPASGLVPVEFISTSIPSVNDIVFACGGVPRGRIIEIFAEESQGKSTFAQWLVGQAQKQGLNAFWVDAEKTFDQEYAKGSGVDTDKLMMLDFSFMEDLHYKLKLMTASNLFDIGVVYSVNSILPQDLGDAKIEGLNMN